MCRRDRGRLIRTTYCFVFFSKLLVADRLQLMKNLRPINALLETGRTRGYIAPPRPKQGDGFIQGHVLILVEIGTHDQSRPIVPVGAVNDAQFLGIVCDEGMHGRGNLEDNRRIHVAPVPQNAVLMIDNLQLTAFRHFHPLLFKLGLTIIVGICHR